MVFEGAAERYRKENRATSQPANLEAVQRIEVTTRYFQTSFASVQPTDEKSSAMINCNRGEGEGGGGKLWERLIKRKCQVNRGN